MNKPRIFSGPTTEAQYAPLFVPECLTGRVLDRMLPTLVGLNEDWLRANPRTPLLYEAGVRYIRDPVGKEQWLCIPWVLKSGGADCKSLACWRAAELRIRGEKDCIPVWDAQETKEGLLLYHVQVQRGRRPIDGARRVKPFAREDPSLALGMGVGENHEITAAKDGSTQLRILKVR